MSASSRTARIGVVLVLALGAAIPASARTLPEELAEASFAWDLYLRLGAGDANLFFSPHSIAGALGMTLLGARGETARQMTQALRADDGWHDRMQRRHELIGGDGAGERPYELTVANALWVQDSYPLRDDYLRATLRRYGAAPVALDFSGGAVAAVRRINDWVAERTGQRIKDLLSADAVTPETRLVLTNAIFFKSAWRSSFNEAATGPEPFHRRDGSTVTVPMMRQVARFGYRDLDGAQALRLPYTGRDLAMVVVLPSTAQGLGALETSLEAGDLLALGWGDELPQRRVEVHLPRFRLEQTLDLVPKLAELGMPAAFSAGDADFSGITGGRDLFIHAVVHKAFVAVDEEGTEAAAATGITMMPTSIAGPEEDPVVFKADRPFLFCIVHQPSRTILFLGRVMDPS